MNIQRDKWIEEGWYDCCGGCWLISYHLYDTNGGRLGSATNVEDIPTYYYFLKDPNKSYANYYEELENGALPDYSHLYEVVYDSSIDHTMNWTCTD